MALTGDQARDLAAQFHYMSVLVGTFRFNQWDSLRPDERSQLENLQWTLLNYSSDSATVAMTQTLSALPAVLQTIENATQQARNAFQSITAVDKAIRIATAAAVLGAAIAVDNPGAIAKAAGDLLTAAAS